jgi:predicted RNA-binding protein associated with RNAse of E/G family
MPAGAEYQVLHFWEDGQFAGWYVNLERPRVRRGSCFDGLDQHLDLVIAPDGTHAWKDVDEAEAAVSAGHLPEADLVAARRTGEAIIQDFRAWLAVVGDWRGWRPPDGFDIPLQLPDDWDAR